MPRLAGGTCSSRLAQSAGFGPPPPRDAISPSGVAPVTALALGTVWGLWVKHPGRRSFRSFSLFARPTTRPAAHSLPNSLLRFIPLLNRRSLASRSQRRTLLLRRRFHPTESPALSTTFFWNCQRIHSTPPISATGERTNRLASIPSIGEFHCWRPGAPGSQSSALHVAGLDLRGERRAGRRGPVIIGLETTKRLTRCGHSEQR
jgi:hypothetical protein